MRIQRDRYLKELISSKGNKLIKIITGIRRCGKSYLLDPIFKEHLLSTGIQDDHIIKINLDERRNRKYRNPDLLDTEVRKRIVDDDIYYLLLDEIQLVDDFESVLNGFLRINNLDIYVTGSNSKFLSSDIITEFRGRGEQIRIYPLSFKEYFSAVEMDKRDAFESYLVYGGMPLILSMKSDIKKANYLKQLFDLTYTKDIIDRNNIKKSDVLERLIDILASSVGSLTNPNKLLNTFRSSGYKDLSRNTVDLYLSYLTDSFLIEKVDRYNIKGKKYIQTPSKYYFADVGLRNARLNFRQIEENHILENIVYLELVRRGYNVDVGVVEIYDKNTRMQLEIDFVCNQGDKRYYIQTTLNLSAREKTLKEERPLLNITDNFKKIIIVKGTKIPRYTEEGILVMGIIDFLLNDNSLEVLF
ncbi:MAG: ATP-binding protein [Bacilli bacterium]|jgi:predicted AAA+ superfamily ATPase